MGQGRLRPAVLLGKPGPAVPQARAGSECLLVPRVQALASPLSMGLAKFLSHHDSTPDVTVAPSDRGVALSVPLNWPGSSMPRLCTPSEVAVSLHPCSFACSGSTARKAHGSTGGTWSRGAASTCWLWLPSGAQGSGLGQPTLGDSPKCLRSTLPHLALTVAPCNRRGALRIPLNWLGSSMPRVCEPSETGVSLHSCSSDE